MENLFEIIIPLILAAFYFFGNIFSGKSKDDSDSGVPSRSDKDTEAVERQRRIQDEIRRKIMERRSESAEIDKTIVSQPLPQSKSSQQEEVKNPSSMKSGNNKPKDNTYAFRMQEHLNKIEATKRQAEKLQKQAEKTGSNNYERTPMVGRNRGYLPIGVRAALRDPAAARTAFIYSEIIGVPVSQKKVSLVPGLS